METENNGLGTESAIAVTRTRSMIVVLSWATWNWTACQGYNASGQFAVSLISISDGIRVGSIAGLR